MLKLACGFLIGALLTVSVDVGGKARWFFSAREILGQSESQQLSYTTGAYDMLSFILETHDSKPEFDWWPLLAKNHQCLGTSATSAGALRAKGSYLFKRGTDGGSGDESAASVLLANACR